MRMVMPTGGDFELVVVSDHAGTARPGADVVSRAITGAEGEAATCCFCTGSSPVPMYAELARRHREAHLSFAGVRAFMLDEYVGLPAGHPACYRTFMSEHLYRHVDILPENLHYFFGPMEDHMQVCFRYEQALAATGGVDLMLLGIGANGHIAFNEPGTRPDSRTRLLRLSESTRQANARYFSSIHEVPTHALSLGIANILEARELLMIAVGANKHDALKRCFTGPVTDEVPASHLQNYTGRLTVVLDEAAADGLVG